MNENTNEESRTPMTGPSQFEWLRSRDQIIDEVIRRMSAAYGTYNFIRMHLSDLHTDTEPTGNDDETPESQHEPQEHDYVGDNKAVIERLDALKPLLRNVLLRLRDIPMPKDVAEVVCLFDEDEIRKVTSDVSPPPRDEEWLLSKLAEIAPAHAALVDDLEDLASFVTGLGWDDPDYWKRTEHGEDLGVPARFVHSIALDLAQEYETGWAALLLARELRKGEAAATGPGDHVADDGVPRTA